MRDATVGLVFFGLIALLLGLTVWVSGPKELFGTPDHVLTARFESVEGLALGNPVWVRGRAAGKVAAIRLHQDSLLVDMHLDADPVLHAEYAIVIRPGSALGGKVVSIDPGPSDGPVFTGEPQGKFRAAGLESVGADIRNAVNDFGSRFSVPLENINRITVDVLEGKGLLGRLIHDQELAERIDRISQNVDDVTAGLSRGEGSLGKLLKDDGLYDKLDSTAGKLDKFANNLDTGKGLLNTLVQDEELANKARKAVDDLASVATRLDQDLGVASGNLREMTETVRAGKGLLGRLVYDEALAERVDTITQDVAQISGKLRNGEGTVGKLIQDDELYGDLRAALDQIGGGAKDARENAPILAFAGFLFGAF